MSARAERIILNPSEVAADGFPEINLHDGSIQVAPDGPDWGIQEVKQFLSEGLFGSRPIDVAWPMRVVTIPLVLGVGGGYDAARIALESAVAQINLEGGWLKREMLGGDYGEAGKKLFCDVTKASLKLGHGTPQVINAIDPNAELILECLPDLYGPVVSAVVGEGTGDVSGTIQVAGELPARVQEMKVEDLSGNDQLGLMWHYRRHHYSADSTAGWVYNAEALGALDIAEKVALTGSYGTKVVKHPKLSTDWTPVLSTGFLTHIGLYNVWVRVWTTSETLPWLRLVYGAGDIVAPQENVQAQVPRKEGFYLLNLGQVNLRTLPFGAQRWEGVIQARGESGGENISIDRVWFQCADECSGVLGALKSTTTLASVVGSDSLVGEGALKESEATRGGKWEEVPSTGTGLSRGAEGAAREVKSDSEGRSALLAGSKVGPVRVQCEFNRSINGENLTQGIYLRYYSSTYWVRVSMKLVPAGVGSIVTPTPYLEYNSGEGAKPVKLKAYAGSALNSGTLDAELDAAGLVTFRLWGSTYRASVPATFKKGETHAEGKVGIYDFNPSSTAVVRTYMGFFASPLPPSDAVVYGNGSAYLSTRGMWRQSADGEGAGPIGHPGSDLPRLPVSGAEETPVEIAVKPSRGLFGELADSGKDKFKVTVDYQPCYASIPES